MAQKVDALEAEAGATKELAELSADQTLEKKFAELENPSNNADRLLLDLKQQMGVLPPENGNRPALPPSDK
jgi:phage shock protein A